MEMNNNNDVVKRLQEAHKRDDREEIDKLERELAEWSKENIQSIERKFDDVRKEEETIDASEKDGAISQRKANGDRRRLYKEMIGLYREARKLSEEISKAKKLMRGVGDED